MNMSDLLGALMQSGMNSSSTQRLQRALGGGEEIRNSRQGGVLGSLLAGALGGTGGGGIGGILGEVLNQAGRAAGGEQNLALGGLGALAGALLGGGRRSVGGAMGGGVMALLGAMAFQALQAKGASRQVPLGLRAPQTPVEEVELERRAEVILKAMINAAKADGRIDEGEIGRIVGRLQEEGADPESQHYVLAEMQRPLETEPLFAAAKDDPELAAQIYGASLMAIEVDTVAEKVYLEKLGSGLGLAPEMTRRIEEMVGLSKG